jgi:hypothetical protein
MPSQHPPNPGLGPAAGLIALLVGCLALACPPGARASAIVAVDSDVSSDYVRPRLPDGSLQPETYAFGNGGYIPWIMLDDTIDKLDFTSVAHAIAGTLAERKYLPARDPAQTRLLIMVYWGTTAGSFDLGLTRGYMEDVRSIYLLQDRERDLVDYHNAGILGYDADGLIGTDEGYWMQTQPGAFGHRVTDEVNDVEHSRYFVVLMAYDFQIMWRRKSPKLLWVTRLSIDQRRNDFARELPAMLRVASGYFGRNSKGLIRDTVPEGQIEVGEVKSLGVVPEK